MTTSRMTRRKFLGTAAFTAALTGTATAQMPLMPSMTLEQEKHKTPDEIEHDKAIDKAYRSATKKIPDKTAVNDPWADVRPAPHAATQPKKKERMSQKHD